MSRIRRGRRLSTLIRQVRRNFNPDRGSGLDTVTIVDMARNVLGQWVREADGSVTQVIGG